MKKIYTWMIGNERHIYEFEGRNLQEIEINIKAALPYALHKCQCGSANLTLRTYRAQNEKGIFHYTKALCLDCKRTLTATHGPEKPDEFFWQTTTGADGKKTLKWEQYQGSNDSRPPQQSAPIQQTAQRQQPPAPQDARPKQSQADPIPPPDDRDYSEDDLPF